MSLIFQSLQKLKANRNASPSGENGPTPEHRQMAVKPLLPRRATLIGLGLVLALGCGTVYAVQVLKQRVQTEQSSSVIEKQRHAIMPTNVKSTPGQTTKPQYDEKFQNVASQPTVKKAAEVQAQFYPPEQKPNTAALAPAVQDATQSSLPLVATQSVGPKPDELPVSPTPLIETQKDNLPVAQTQPVSDAAVEAAERARRAAFEKSARIGRLVRRIEQAIAGAPNVGDPKALLAQLAQIKGQDHPYVMKLRAYWNFKHGRHSAAEEDLKKVIAIHPDDLEAGINLALIEIQAQRFSEALDRLKRLRHNYPDEPMVADLIKRLN